MSDQTRKLAAIVFTDLAGFSELSSSDENLAIELVNTQHKIINQTNRHLIIFIFKDLNINDFIIFLLKFFCT